MCYQGGCCWKGLRAAASSAQLEFHCRPPVLDASGRTCAPHGRLAHASLTPGPGEHLSACVSPSYASALGHVGQKAGSTRNAHAPHPASGVSRRTLEGMLFCLGRATKTNYDGSEHNNLQALWIFGLQLPGCKQDPAKTHYHEAQLLLVYALDSGPRLHIRALLWALLSLI